MAKFYYGGQAVIEGVMMRGQRHMAVAVRAPSGEIIVRQEPLDAVIYKSPWMKMPFLRGIVGLWDAIGLGMKAIMFSADVAAAEPDGQDAASAAPQARHQAQVPPLAGDIAMPAAPQASPGPLPSGGENQQASAFSGPAAWGMIAVALAIMVGLFFVLPVFAAGLLTGLANVHSSVAENIIEGVIRLGLFLGYIWAIGHMSDMQRVFGYHGAEHKTINAYEAGVPLTPEKVQGFTLLNPRCGTTFLLIVMLLATVLFVLMGKLPFGLTVLSRIVLVPLVAAVSYEFIRLMANLYDRPVVRTLMAPALALQKMTTRPPDLAMIEVGITALQAVLVADGVLQAEEPAEARESGEPAAAAI